MSEFIIRNENIIDPLNYDEFLKQLNEGFGFSWQQDIQVIPGRMNPEAKGIWTAKPNELIGSSQDVKFLLELKRIGISTANDVQPPKSNTQTTENLDGETKTPVAPKTYGRYIASLFMQLYGSRVKSYDSRRICDIQFDGLEQNRRPVGMIEFLRSKFQITNIKPFPMGPNVRTAQSNFSNWYSGGLPDPKQLEQYLGTGNIDASQISSFFGGVNKAVSLVNQFDSSLLTNIAFVFNTSGNAYGVYVPALDMAINKEKTKSILKEKGCIVEDLPDGSFTARPQDPKKMTVPQIQQEINRIESELKNQGGHAFGVNMNKVLESARADQQGLQQKTSKDFELLAILHLGETMAHEATHAKGHRDESVPQSIQQSFVQWALPKLNEERRATWLQENPSSTAEQYIPVQISSLRQATNWYRHALEKLSFSNKGFGNASWQSRLQQNIQKPQTSNEGAIPSWAGMFWKGPHAAIENMLLTVQHESSSNKDSIEKRMCKERQKRETQRRDPHMSIEEMIEPDRKTTDAYSSTEKLLEDQRPKPLILSREQTAMVRLGYTSGIDAYDPGFENFGWMQNLDLSSRDRKKTGPSIDDDLATNQDEAFKDDSYKSVRFQPRYNPEYPDKNGYRGMFYAIYYEPRFEPELWSRMEDERTRTGPASRTAGRQLARCRELADFILYAFQKIEDSICNGEFQGTRLLMSPTLVDATEEHFQGISNLRTVVCEPSNGYYPIWVVSKLVSDDKVQLAENYLRDNNNQSEAFKAFDQITNLSRLKRKIIEKILESAKEICRLNGMNGVYVCGGFPRSLVLNEPYSEIRDLDFSSAWPDECLKLGGLLAEKLGVEFSNSYHKTMTLTWNYCGIKCDFRGKYATVADRQLFHDAGVKTTPLNLDVYSRDLTVNMFVYLLDDGKIYDVTHQSLRDIKSKVLRTYFPADKVVASNPIVILRTIKYAVRYPDFSIDKDLQNAMHNNIDNLIQNVDADRLLKGFIEIIREGKTYGRKILAEYGLDKLYKKIVESNYADSN